MANSSRRGIVEPENKESLGYAVYLIIRDQPLKLRQHAEKLGMDPARMSQFLHGHVGASQQFVAEKQWKAVFAEHYTTGWAAHAETFNVRLAASPAMPGRGGGRKPGSAKTAKTKTAFTGAAASAAPITASDHADFNIEPAYQPSKAELAARAAAQDWRKTAGAAIAAVVDRRGDDAPTLAAETNSPGLKAAWGKILACDPNVPSTLYKDAIRATTSLYQLSVTSRDPADAASAKKLDQILKAAPL